MAKIIKEVSQGLHTTLKLNKHIDMVYFTETGEHYFNVHELIERRTGKKTGRFFGFLKTEFVEDTVKLRGGGTEKKMRMISVENPATEIAETLTRRDVLALPIFEVEEKKRAEAKLAKEEVEKINRIKKSLKDTEEEGAELVGEDKGKAKK